MVNPVTIAIRAIVTKSSTSVMPCLLFSLFFSLANTLYASLSFHKLCRRKAAQPLFLKKLKSSIVSARNRIDAVNV